MVQAIPVHYTVLEGKFAGQDIYAGQLVKLGAKTAELHSDEPVAALSTLKLELLRPDGQPVPGELFAKVLGDDPNQTDTAAVMRFTSVPQDIQAFLDAAERRFEYHVINRSVQL